MYFNCKVVIDQVIELCICTRSLFCLQGNCFVFSIMSIILLIFFRIILYLFQADHCEEVWCH